MYVKHLQEYLDKFIGFAAAHTKTGGTNALAIVTA